jgi:cytoskeletal protein CcmA (bactofilin family)
MTIFKRQSDKLESLIGPQSEFRGDVRVSGTLRVDGKLLGNAEAGWIVVGVGAEIKGDLTASGVYLGGNLQGNITAEDIVEIRPGGRLLGDVSAKKLVIAEGGMFVGRSDMYCGETRLIDGGESVK